MSEKLHKVLARLGVGSRREIERLIAAGRVRVDGAVASLGVRVDGDERVDLDGRRLDLGGIALRSGRVIVYNKPEGEICTRRDPGRRRTVYESLPPPGDGRWIAVGRLDINTSGLLLFTTDGELANGLMHPRRGLEREYLCRVRGPVARESLERLRAGIEIDGEQAKFMRVEHRSGSGVNQWYRVVLRRGHYREVRRLWQAVGNPVSRLVRIRFGSIRLPRTLARGGWVELDRRAVETLRRTAGIDHPNEGR